MNNIYFYLILSVFLYFIFTRVLENFLVEQENFDPSLVPVSSIVTLAKVAQKLVNGNGTLTNPGNLQIGASTSAPGNLTVTGNINLTAGSGNNGIKITSSNPYIEFNKTGVPSSSSPQIFSDGTILHALYAPFQVDQNLTVNGTAKISSGLSVTGNTILSTGNTYGGSLSLLQGSGTSGEAPFINFMQNDNTTRNAFIQGSNTGITLSAPSTTISNNLTVNGNIKIGNKAMLCSGRDAFNIASNGDDGWIRLMKADGTAAYSDPGFAAKSLYSALDTSVTRDLTVGGTTTLKNTVINGDLNANGIGTFNNFKIGPIRIQCGYSGGSSQWVYFATAFSNIPVVNAYFASTDDSAVNTGQWAPWAINISATRFQVRNAGSTATSWFAIGPA